MMERLFKLLKLIIYRKYVFISIKFLRKILCYICMKKNVWISWFDDKKICVLYIRFINKDMMKFGDFGNI